MAKKATTKNAGKSGNSTPGDPIVKELEDIKRLQILALIRDGATQGEIAVALGVNQSSVSRMFPGGVGKPSAKR